MKRYKNTNFNKQTSGKYTGLVILFLLFYASVSAQVWKVERDQLLRENFIYSAFRPAGAIDISSKMVELFYKKKGDTEILVLINHSNTKQDTEIYSSKAISLHDPQGGRLLGEGFRIPVSVEPLAVVIFNLKHL